MKVTEAVIAAAACAGAQRSALRISAEDAVRKSVDAICLAAASDLTQGA